MVNESPKDASLNIEYHRPTEIFNAGINIEQSGLGILHRHYNYSIGAYDSGKHVTDMIRPLTFLDICFVRMHYLGKKRKRKLSVWSIIYHALKWASCNVINMR